MENFREAVIEAKEEITIDSMGKILAEEMDAAGVQYLINSLAHYMPNEI